MVKLILVRHALTVDNQKSRLSGHIDSSISEEGKEQIDKITKTRCKKSSILSHRCCGF